MQNKATIVGILSCVSGIFGIFWLGYAFFLSYWLKAMPEFFGSNVAPDFTYNWLGFMQTIYIIWGSLAAVIGIFAIIAGVFTMKRTNWSLALAGAISSTITFFPCGIPAIILISFAQDEFKK